MATYDDKQLLEMFAREDDRDRAFALILEKYSRRIYWVIRKMVVSHHDADDLTQNVMLKLWTSLPGFRGEAGLYTWIYRIAINESLSFLRSKRSRFFVSLSAEDLSRELTNMLAGEDLYDGNEIQKALDTAVLRLPTRQRLVFNMRYYDEMPYEKMEEVLGTSQGSLKASYHHAVKKVEQWVEEEIGRSGKNNTE